MKGFIHEPFSRLNASVLKCLISAINSLLHQVKQALGEAVLIAWFYKRL